MGIVLPCRPAVDAFSNVAETEKWNGHAIIAAESDDVSGQ